MAKVTENNCLRCERCIDCGLDNQVRYVCDYKNCSADAEYELDERHYCYRCLLRKLEDIYKDEIIEDFADVSEIITECFDEVKERFEVKKIEWSE